MRILIVEDDPGIRVALQLLLRFEGYPSRSVDRGEEALELLRAERFGLVLLDLNTHGISAREFMTGLSSRRPSIGILSASHRIELEASQLGADFYVRKPFDSEDLMSRIGQVAARQGFSPFPSGSKPVTFH